MTSTTPETSMQTNPPTWKVRPTIQMPSIGDEADNPQEPVPPSLSFEEWMGGITEGATGPGVPGGDPPQKNPQRADAPDAETPSSYGLTTDLLPPLPPTFEQWEGGIEAGRKGVMEPGTPGKNLLGGVTFHRPRRPGRPSEPRKPEELAGPSRTGEPSRVEAQQMLAGSSRTGGPTRWDTPITEPLPYPAPTNAFHGLLVGIGHAHGPSNQRGYITEQVEGCLFLQGEKFPTTFYVYDLGPEELILGLPWIRKNGLKIDWENENMVIPDRNVRITRTTLAVGAQTITTQDETNYGDDYLWESDEGEPSLKKRKL
ncbi:hypothetical protein A0H81_13360 [Grifola frondosa]|uniref:Uncharacterized protein n=1 Tax=Grifola frondosa TaxID=5627 RepID=A0A1C7LQ58_GRIFR|nr:hypothetical protein A0H81_13360 [Grifola frondosa]